ncbi:putative Tetratricopeptide repeat-like superfamily protein [Hibiscus syriacus]|uniref:Tetratricopeptide repeat-like superfamily protein n=1 Tax=Hibiscus syriacus TaxID=106335 RepID=A0A6A2WQQ8_HIBSY|nr:putative Tetratricopeptide repeat-like superfamily protein [Hibiscus syriacus]
MLVKYAVLCKAKSYGEVVEVAMGRTARVLSEICIIVNNAGVLVVYLIIIGDEDIGLGHPGAFPCTTLFLKQNRFIEHYISCISRFSSCFRRNLPTCRAHKADRRQDQVPEDKPRFRVSKNNPGPTSGDPGHIGRIRLSLQRPNDIQRTRRPITTEDEQSSKDHNHHLHHVLRLDRHIGVPPLRTAYRYSTALNYIVRVGYVLHLVLVFPVIHFLLRETVDNLVFHGSAPLVESKRRSLALTAVLLVLIYLGSTAIPNIWTAFKYTGATTWFR